MTTKEKTPDTDVPFGQMPYWLTNSDDLSHSQFRILCVLRGLLGGRSKPLHFTYQWLAKAASTDPNTVTVAMTKFRDKGWVVITGRQQHRKYILDMDKLRDDLRTTGGDWEDPDA